MQRALLAVVVAVLMTSAPASAQLFPAQPAAGERILLDATIWVNPAISQELCMAIGPGQVAVTTRRTSNATQQRPAEFQFSGFRADQGASLKVAIEGQETSGTTRVTGGDHYCWRIQVYAPEVQVLTIFEQGEYVQQIAVKIVHRPD